MALAHTAVPIRGLGKQKAAAVLERAKRLGMTPQRYLRHLVEEDLAVSERAKSSSFKKLLGPGEVAGGAADEEEIDRLVENAKTRYHQRNSRKG